MYWFSTSLPSVGVLVKAGSTPKDWDRDPVQWLTQMDARELLSSSCGKSAYSGYILSGVVSVKRQVLVLYFKITCSYIAVLLKSPSISEIIKSASIDHSGQTTSLHKDFFKGVCCIISQYP